MITNDLLKVETIAKARLKANSITNQNTSSHSIYLMIEENSFIYSNDDKKAPLVLKVIDPTGKEVINILNLICTSDGCDITEKHVVFKIIDNYEISANPETVQNWKFEILYLNNDVNQKINANKNFSARIFMTAKDNYALLINNYYNNQYDAVGNINTQFSDKSLATKPVFYLNSDVNIVNDIGTLNDPYIIK